MEERNRRTNESISANVCELLLKLAEAHKLLGLSTKDTDQVTVAETRTNLTEVSFYLGSSLAEAVQAASAITACLGELLERLA